MSTTACSASSLSSPVSGEDVMIEQDDETASRRITLVEGGCPQIDAFQSHWNQIKAAVSCSEQLNEDTVQLIFGHVGQLIALLISSTQAAPEVEDECENMEELRSALREVLDREEIFPRLTTWCLADCRTSAWGDTVAQRLLKAYETLVNQPAKFVRCFRHSYDPLPHLCKELLSDVNPLARSGDTEECVAILMHQVCTKTEVVVLPREVSRYVQVGYDSNPAQGSDPTAAPPSYQSNVFFDLDDEPTPPSCGDYESRLKNVTFLKLMVPFLFREDRVGQLFRDSLLFVLAHFNTVGTVVTYIAEESNFCPVLASGLAGLYSALPRRFASLTVPDDWCSLTSADINAVGNLRSFCCVLEFCNAVMQVAHECICQQLISFVYDGFLSSILKVALQESVEEDVFAVTAYFELVCRLCKEPPLRESIVKLLLSELGDGQCTLLDLIVSRLRTSNSSLFRVSLSLIETLIQFCSESFMFELAFKYLVPKATSDLSKLAIYQKVTTGYIDAAAKYAILSSAASLRHKTKQSSDSPQNRGTGESDILLLSCDFDECLILAGKRFHDVAAACSSWNCHCDAIFSDHAEFCVNSHVQDECLYGSDGQKCVSEYNRFTSWNEKLVQLPRSSGLCDSMSQFPLSYLRLTFVENSVMKVDEETATVGELSAETPDPEQFRDRDGFRRFLDTVILSTNGCEEFGKEDAKTTIGRLHDSHVDWRELVHGPSDDADGQVLFPRCHPSHPLSPPETPFEDGTAKNGFDDEEMTRSSASDLGPFITVMFDKLKSMVDNNRIENVLITSVISLLACFPVSMMRQLLQDSTKSVSSLMQVLSSVQNDVERFADAAVDFKAELRQARAFLDDGQDRTPPWQQSQLPRSPQLCDRLPRTKVNTLHAKHRYQRLNLKPFQLLRHSSTKTKPDYLNNGTSVFYDRAPKSWATCAIFLENFCKELAAICLQRCDRLYP